MNPFEKHQEPKVKVAAKAKTSFVPIFALLILSVVVLGVSNAARGF